MGFSAFLEQNKQNCISLVKELRKEYSYVSILGTDIIGYRIDANKNKSGINEGMGNQSGFVIKMTKGDAFYEYSFDHFETSIEVLAKKIVSSLSVTPFLQSKMIQSGKIEDEKHVESFSRDSDFDEFSNQDLLKFCVDNTKSLLKLDDHLLNAYTIIMTQNVSKLFVTENKCLDQHYTWGNGVVLGIYRGDNGKISMPRDGHGSNKLKEIMEVLPTKLSAIPTLGYHLSQATPIKAGYYDVITAPSISGLIAHEAFGHGVEMDQFVKDRALAKNMVGEYVASPIVNMRDGASTYLSVASYFFDDDGVLAHNTKIIDQGILVSGISDLVSANELKTAPTGNGRRESFKRKAYARMTNTIFEAGESTVEEMIASVKHGYLLFDTNNGMEDPKNWQIQCVCEYGIEIVDGKLTDHYVSPVVMSGYVPDLLKSITMVSNEVITDSLGMCGKGYKEYVYVSDGGPYLKAKVKLS